MNERKYKWHSDFMASELGYCDDSEEDFIIGMYSLYNYPNIILYIDIVNNNVIKVWKGVLSDLNT